VLGRARSARYSPAPVERRRPVVVRFMVQGLFVLLLGCSALLPAADALDGATRLQPVVDVRGSVASLDDRSLDDDDAFSGREVADASDVLDLDLENAMIGATGAFVGVGAAAVATFFLISAVGIFTLPMLFSAETQTTAAAITSVAMFGILLVPLVGAASALLSHVLQTSHDVGISAAGAAFIIGSASGIFGAVLGLVLTAALVYGLSLLAPPGLATNDPIQVVAWVVIMGAPLATAIGVTLAAAGSAAGAFVGGAVDGFRLVNDLE